MAERSNLYNECARKASPVIVPEIVRGTPPHCGLFQILRILFHVAMTLAERCNKTIH